MSRLAFLLVLVCGCHRVFDLVRDDDPDAGRGADSTETDAAKGCWAVGEGGDEDLDQRIDGCDPCPADVDAVVVDEDGDGVGDQCDPSSDLANAIVAFDGFRSEAPWKLTGGAWTRTDPNQGEFTQGITSDSSAVLTISPVRFPTIDVRFVPGTITTINNHGAGAELVFPSTTVSCVYEYRDDADAVVLYIDNQESSSSPFDRSGAVRIQLSSLVGGTVQCQAISGSPSGVVSHTVVVPEATVRVGLVTKADTARFQSMTIFGTP